jgi:hypothetical protein
MYIRLHFEPYHQAVAEPIAYKKTVEAKVVPVIKYAESISERKA